MPHSRSLFRSSALASELITLEQLEAAIDEVRGGETGPPATLIKVKDEALADKLVEQDLISRYQADQLLDGRSKFNLGVYVITDFIGQGGMGQVFKAEHRMMGREVAVKVLPKPRSTPEAEANFHREIRLQAKLDHPNLVRAYDAGHDGSVYYLVVEYVPGTDLRRLVRSQGKLSLQHAATVIMQAALGLDHAHGQGLIHRDVKPGNLLVTPEGHTKVSDLGLAGFMDEGEADPRAGKIVGTADYISPEVFRSPNDVSPVSDIYSLGCTFYYAVTGKVPYPGGTTREKLERHLNDTPYHPRRFVENIPEEFVETIADMMEKEPDNRIQTAAEVVARLKPWTAEQGPTSIPTDDRWAPPPLPTGSGTGPLIGDEDDETADGDYPDADSFSQGSQGTTPNAAASQDTRADRPPSRPPPPLAADSATLAAPPSTAKSVLVALTIAVPLAMITGAVLMLVLLLALWT